MLRQQSLQTPITVCIHYTDRMDIRQPFLIVIYNYFFLYKELLPILQGTSSYTNHANNQTIRYDRSTETEITLL